MVIVVYYVTFCEVIHISMPMVMPIHLQTSLFFMYQGSSWLVWTPISCCRCVAFRRQQYGMGNILLTWLWSYWFVATSVVVRGTSVVVVSCELARIDLKCRILLVLALSYRLRVFMLKSCRFEHKLCNY